MSAYTEDQLKEIKEFFWYREVKDYVPQTVYVQQGGEEVSRQGRYIDKFELYRFIPKKNFEDMLSAVSSNDLGQAMAMALSGINTLKKHAKHELVTY